MKPQFHPVGGRHLYVQIDNRKQRVPCMAECLSGTIDAAAETIRINSVRWNHKLICIHKQITFQTLKSYHHNRLDFPKIRFYIYSIFNEWIIKKVSRACDMVNNFQFNWQNNCAHVFGSRPCWTVSRIYDCENNRIRRSPPIEFRFFIIIYSSMV